MSGYGPFRAQEMFLHLRDDGGATPLPVTPAFWEKLGSGQMPELEQGRLISTYTFAENWAVWERHPAGDEMVLLLSGAAEFLLELPGGLQSVAVTEPGSYLRVPAGIWHTARTQVATTMMFLTPGAGTEHRAV
ncbi:cupin domain-containing protein [Solimonas sp. K1W22B-7]|uniref:cupin domain-containing protein n=1 Tax=Solimonas sp. K1W22B-7 TaxID=2303331 RepID=UPI000E32E54E|nr:cupin domain-containing protein [Solimonas sp. K1W22B-7]AXQ30197.1 cupin domain-containing protein [Solimonas sp. K1W22B-7]